MSSSILQLCNSNSRNDFGNKDWDFWEAINGNALHAFFGIQSRAVVNDSGDNRKLNHDSENI